MLNLTFGASKTLYGLGVEDIGVYVIQGKLDPSTYDIKLTKSYLGPKGFGVDYYGKMINNGLFWVISGNYQLKTRGRVQKGTFEVFREAPEEQKNSARNGNRDIYANVHRQSAHPALQNLSNPLAQSGQNILMGGNSHQQHSSRFSMNQQAPPPPVFQQA